MATLWDAKGLHGLLFHMSKFQQETIFFKLQDYSPPLKRSRTLFTLALLLGVANFS